MPIFVIGTRRSGSNLLRLMFNQLPGIAAPHPPHVLQRMMSLVPNYGDLARSENFAALVEDVCRLVELNPVPWEGVRLDRADIARRCRNRSLVAVFGAVYEALADARGAKTWLCESLQNVLYLPEIEAYFPDARYIYLYRDGRDVAVSFRKAAVGERHFYHIAKEWAGDQRLALKHRSLVPPQRFVGFSYETLTTHPEEIIRRLCEFLGVTYHGSMLEFYKSDEARRAAESSMVCGNVVKPIVVDNTRKFLREASEEDIRIFESVAGDVLNDLGYERAYVRRGEERQFTREEIRRFGVENRDLREEILRGMDAADIKRRDRQEALLAEIRRRPETATA